MRALRVVPPCAPLCFPPAAAHGPVAPARGNCVPVDLSSLLSSLARTDGLANLTETLVPYLFRNSQGSHRFRQLKKGKLNSLKKILAQCSFVPVQAERVQRGCPTLSTEMADSWGVGTCDANGNACVGVPFLSFNKLLERLLLLGPHCSQRV